MSGDTKVPQILHAPQRSRDVGDSPPEGGRRPSDGQLHLRGRQGHAGGGQRRATAGGGGQHEAQEKIHSGTVMVKKVCIYATNAVDLLPVSALALAPRVFYKFVVS